MTGKRLPFALIVGALLLFATLPTPAMAAAAAPQAVSEWFANKAVPFIVENSVGEVSAGNSKTVDFSEASHTGTVIEVHAWTADFVKGGKYSAATSATGEWIASIHAGARVLGTVTARYTPATDLVEFVAYDDFAELGRGLDRANAKATVVFDGQTGSWMALQASAVVPLTPQGDSLVSGSPAIADFQKKLAKRHADAIVGAQGIDDAVGGGAPTFDAESWNSSAGYVASGVLLLAGLGLLAVYVVRRRREAPEAD